MLWESKLNSIEHFLIGVKRQYDIYSPSKIMRFFVAPGMLKYGNVVWREKRVAVLERQREGAHVYKTFKALYLLKDKC